MKAKINYKNIKGFLQGNMRMFLSDLPYFIPEHIKEQVRYRVAIMDIQCLKNKQCPCECQVPNKQFEDRPCENNCYGEILSKEDWEQFKKVNLITEDFINSRLYKRKKFINNHL